MLAQYSLPDRWPPQPSWPAVMAYRMAQPAGPRWRPTSEKRKDSSPPAAASRAAPDRHVAAQATTRLHALAPATESAEQSETPERPLETPRALAQRPSAPAPLDRFASPAAEPASERTRPGAHSPSACAWVERSRVPKPPSARAVGQELRLARRAPEHSAAQQLAQGFRPETLAQASPASSLASPAEQLPARVRRQSLGHHPTAINRRLNH